MKLNNLREKMLSLTSPARKLKWYKKKERKKNQTTPIKWKTHTAELTNYIEIEILWGQKDDEEKHEWVNIHFFSNFFKIMNEKILLQFYC